MFKVLKRRKHINISISLILTILSKNVNSVDQSHILKIKKISKWIYFVILIKIAVCKEKNIITLITVKLTF